MFDPVTHDAEHETAVFAVCYQELLPEFMALEPDDIRDVNLDITAIVGTMLAAHSTVVPRLEQLERAAPLLDRERMRRLDAYAMALRHAHTLYLIATDPPAKLRPLAARGMELRGLMLRDARDLLRRGRIQTARLDELLGPVGYKNLASDLLVLSGLFREHLPRIQGRCQTTEADIRSADAIAADILRAVGRKEQRSALIAETVDVRKRAFTVVTALYDQVRRAIVFLRWNDGDADNIAPSLFIRRHLRKRLSSKPAKLEQAPSLEVQQPPEPAPPVPAETSPTTVPADDPFLS
ncbi:MAG: hypothetical protein M3020_15380 [Myxococcota bacterium]|nr:hypothetical protein [Myxococcota bacterium]